MREFEKFTSQRKFRYIMAEINTFVTLSDLFNNVKNQKRVYQLVIIVLSGVIISFKLRCFRNVSQNLTYLKTCSINRAVNSSFFTT
jgi:hypothetical protein